MPRAIDNEFAAKLGQRIQARRQWLDMGQGPVAKRLGITRAMLSRYECGLNVPSALMMVRMATILGTTTGELLGDAEPTADGRAHIDDMARVLADPHICAVVRHMDAMLEPDRAWVSKWVGDFRHALAFPRERYDDSPATTKPV